MKDSSESDQGENSQTNLQQLLRKSRRDVKRGYIAMAGMFIVLVYCQEALPGDSLSSVICLIMMGAVASVTTSLNQTIKVMECFSAYEHPIRGTLKT